MTVKPTLLLLIAFVVANLSGCASETPVARYSGSIVSHVDSYGAGTGAPPDGEDFTGIGWLTAYVPGQRATEFPVGFARRVPAGSKFVFQMHYTPNGKEQLDQTKIGMNFIDEESVTHEVFTLAGIDQEFEIPPGSNDHAVEAIVPWLPKDGVLLAAMPHMHLRGKSFQIKTSNAGANSIVLDVPHYDFNWQHT